MQARRKTRAALDRHYKQGGVRIAAVQLSPACDDPVDSESGVKRAIPKGYAYDTRALKPLAKMLWSMSVALGHALTAHRRFARLKSSTISPDGLVGGRGYVMAIKDVRKLLHNACEALSAVSDTIHDEVNAPHWKPRLAQLEKEDLESVQRLVGDAERILDDPDVDDVAEEEEEEGEGAGSEWVHPASREKKEEAEASRLPGGGNAEPVQNLKQAKTANSSLPVESLPGGPRVVHLDPGDVDKTGPFGSWNIDEPISLADEWGHAEEKSSASVLPDAVLEGTPTQALDFGIGLGGGDQATGQGFESGFDLASGEDPWKTSESELPNDGEPDAARSDYYKGSAVAESGLPGGETVVREYDLNSSPASRSHRYERANEPYVRWHDSTRNMRVDPVSQRDPIQGPFVKPATKRPSDG